MLILLTVSDLLTDLKSEKKKKKDTNTPTLWSETERIQVFESVFLDYL